MGPGRVADPLGTEMEHGCPSSFAVKGQKLIVQNPKIPFGHLALCYWMARSGELVSAKSSLKE